MDELLEEVRRLVASAAKREAAECGLDADLFADLAIDSLEGLKLMATLEKRFGVLLPDHLLLSLNTPRKIAEAIEEGRVKA